MTLVLPLASLPDRDFRCGLGEITRIMVIGARGIVGPDRAATELDALFDAHHYTDGLELLAPGTATNSVPGARAGYTSRPACESSR